MRRILLFFTLLCSICSFAQVQEDFSDNDFTENPTWIGTTANFMMWQDGPVVGADRQVRLNANYVSTISYLATPSHAIRNAEWEGWFRINCSTTIGNNSSFYLVAQSEKLYKTKGYYVMIGNTEDEISLYRQDSISATKIIDGVDKRVDFSSMKVMIKVTRDSLGEWRLYSKIVSNGESNYTLEGSVVDNTYKTCNYTGFSCLNSASNSYNYYFDSIRVAGGVYDNPIIDKVSPTLETHVVSGLDSIQLSFSEPIDFSHAALSLNNGIGSLSSFLIASDKKSIVIKTPTPLSRGINYSLSFTGLADLAGNSLTTSSWSFSIPDIPITPEFPNPLEKLEPGDLIINEVLFNSPDSAQEFVELYNKSDRVLNLSGLKVTTRKTDGSLNSGSVIPPGSSISPKGYIALCKTPRMDSLYFNCPTDSRFATMSSWPALNNDGATIVLCNAAKDTIYDELSYSPKWHHPLIKNVQGVSLERINPDLPTQDAKSWHSASSEVNYGTPGYKNSQYLDISTTEIPKECWIENENFTPNNDGDKDLLLLHYNLPENGWMANISIFDTGGQKIKSLYKSYLLSTEGILAWDGSTDNNRPANIGLYVIYVELFNASKGETKRHKLVCAVSGK